MRYASTCEGLVTVQQTMDVLVDVHSFRRGHAHGLLDPGDAAAAGRGG